MNTNFQINGLETVNSLKLAKKTYFSDRARGVYGLLPTGNLDVLVI